MSDNRKLHATPDALAFIAKLMRQSAMTIGARAKRLGGMLQLSRPTLERLKVVRMLHRRFSQGDYRISKNEWMTAVALADEVIREHATQNHMPEPDPLDHDFTQAVSRAPLTTCTYLDVCSAIATGEIG